ncbi:MAG TPA: S16 family serine protease, partial [Candidatus Paceibacterota bacterium]|nr:S16 family serine protease [Candidatus Paceibacterota bacterium]
ERQLATIVRKVTRKLVESPSARTLTVTPATLHSYLGPIKYLHQEAEARDEVGVATGLAWTPVGGETMPIEVTKIPGNGRLIITGQLGAVMKESAQAALSFARAWVAKHGVKETMNKEDVHIHIPAGAVRKDGPSAGIAMTTALVSLFMDKAVRKDVAMTGEVTLRGKVLDIGGLKEKALAAHRAGIKIVVLPQGNKRDLDDIPKEIQRDMKFVFVKNVDEVLKVALR